MLSTNKKIPPTWCPAIDTGTINSFLLATVTKLWHDGNINDLIKWRRWRWQSSDRHVCCWYKRSNVDGDVNDNAGNDSVLVYPDDRKYRDRYSFSHKYYEKRVRTYGTKAARSN